MTPEDVVTVLYSFCPKAPCADGYGPGDLMQATDGYLYGTTELGGPTRSDFGNDLQDFLKRSTDYSLRFRCQSWRGRAFWPAASGQQRRFLRNDLYSEPIANEKRPQFGGLFAL
jgi:hypothetical protein